MPTTIPDHFKVSYANDIALAAQRKGSDLMSTVRVDRVEGEQKFYDSYSPIVLKRKEGRNATHTHEETTRDRRRILPETFGYAELIDNGDEGAIMRRMSADSSFTENLLVSVDRGRDQQIFLGFEADAMTGKNGETPVAFDGNQEFDFNGFTTLAAVYEGILEMGQILDEADVPDDGQRFFVYPPRMHNMIKRIAQMTSGDFIETKILPSGNKSFVFDGFQFVRTTVGLDPEVNVVDRCYAYHKQAMVFGERDDYGAGVHIDTIPEKWHSEQFAVYLVASAVRRFENQIVRGIDIPLASTVS